MKGARLAAGGIRLAVLAFLLFSPDARRIRSVIVDRRDDWAPGTKLVTVPIEALSLPPDLGEAAALDYSRERWE